METSVLRGKSFRLAHLSDLHLDYRSGRLKNDQDINLREYDGYTTFAKIVNDVIAHEVDAVVIAGDIYHSPKPEVRAIVFAQNQLRKLASANIPVYMLAGNHDTNDIQSDIAASRILNDPLRNLYSHAEPYVRHEIADGIHLHLVSHHMYSLQSETMKDVKPVPGEINIFSTHGSCIDPFLQEKLKTESSPREIVIPDFLLMDEDWSYSLLGHIHERGWVGSSDKQTDTANRRIYYNGSIIRRGFSDKEIPLGRGWTLWDIDSSGEFTATPRRVAQRPQFDFPMLDAIDYSPSELTDAIVSRLKQTQINGATFDAKTAPLLRQKIKNLSPSKHAGLDLKAIEQESVHSFTAPGKIITPIWNWDFTDNSVKDSPKGHDENKSVDMITAFDEWVDDSDTFKSLDEKIQDRVRSQTRDFVTLGQDKVFEEE